MTINNWLKQIFIHYASSKSSNQSYEKNINKISIEPNNINRSDSLNTTLTDRCLIVDKPSTMSDADIMYCNDKKNQNQNFLSNNATEMKSPKQNTIILDKFKVCFIDCVCQCEARKIFSQLSINECKNRKSQLFEDLFDQIRGSSYDINCFCNCGKKGMRKLKFNYAYGDKISAMD
ncbi:unnamed protein product [Rotaria sp. Silwood1]|nr:unnamed protein product [Rotaria sp. Silwood1]CAF3458244.1 unnamed protein product [Rotaria sp. Silwood1]CAF3465236.1 unnamed protein product [Rotaria sp. Silwood1]CAF4589761.1 unnamed protein product [Rotaria sp. Silwood1]CAF4890876.1 unnamed protein product [Rotaria sp. Silwood1]